MPGKHANIVPEVPRMLRMRHRRALEMMRGSGRLLRQHALDHRNGFFVGIVARQRVLDILLGQKKHCSILR